MKATTVEDPFNNLDPEEQDELAGDGDEVEDSLPWPEMGSDAFIGLAGDIVNEVDKYTEADRKAVLLHTLAAFGNVIGNGPHMIVNADRHTAKIDVVLVGETSKGRKGTAWSAPREILRRCDEPWVEDRIRSGLSTGEGLIFHVRDAADKDEGVSDKRLLVVEPEFSAMLRIMAREGNSLSQRIREAWDSDKLTNLTKNSPLTATGVHFSLIGHTTITELLRYLDNTEMGNGFANRFLFCCVKRSKLVPDGDPFPVDLLDKLGARMRDVVEWSRNMESMSRDSLASEFWHKVYGVLSEGKPGLSGAILNRAEAQVLRLSLIYALLDKSRSISIKHVQAGLSVWDCCEQSVLYIFGDKIGDPVADKIITELRKHQEMTRDEIINMFNRHRTDQVDRALAMLERIGRIQSEQKPTGGRPVSIYRIARKARKAR